MQKRNLKYCFFNEFDTLNQIIYMKKIYKFLFMLNFEYPNFTNWYFSLFNEMGMLKKSREILICLNNNDIAGVAILKHDIKEDKICTLRVAKKYQHMGIGQTLIEKSLEYLENEKPLITIHVSKYHDFEKIFNKFNFSLEQQIKSYYGLLRSELSYNGILSNNIKTNNLFASDIIFNIEKIIYNYPQSSKKILYNNVLLSK